MSRASLAMPVRVMVLAVLCGGGFARSEPTWVLNNGSLRMTVEARGAIISDLQVGAAGTSWLSQPSRSAPAEPFAHFLAFDRWGPVTPEEAAAGFPFHGEAARVRWTPISVTTDHRLEVAATLPRSGLAANRRIQLSPKGGAFQIRTEVRNPTAQVRPYNLVEHITLSDAWSDASVRLRTNAGEGILHRQGKPMADVSVDWPWARRGSEERWDLRRAGARPGRFIAALRFPAEAEWGWVCLQHPRSGALLAYVWPTAAMPWLNLYWFANPSGVVSRAVEPGTTGLHRPMAELMEAPPLLGHPPVHRLDPGQSRGFVLRGGLAVGGEDFGLLADLRATPEGWAAVDESGRQLMLVSQVEDG